MRCLNAYNYFVFNCKKMKNIRVLDLFAGAGGLSEGFISTGFNIVSHVELDVAACYTLKTRIAYHYLKRNANLQHYYDYLSGKISRNHLYDLIPEVELRKIINLSISKDTNQQIFDIIDKNNDNQQIDVIIGGPPCQAYSLVGRARCKDGMKNDPRNYLYIEYGKYLERYNPKIFVFENVLGLKSANGGLHLQNMKKLFNQLGYDIKLLTVDAKNFGVLQNRKRVIIIGWLKSINLNVPALDLIEYQHNYKVGDLLYDLPRINAGGGADRAHQYRTDVINEYLLNHSIRNNNDVLTQHIARPHNEQDLDIYKIVVNAWNLNGKRLSYNDLPNKLKTHNNKTSFMDRFKIVASNLSTSQTIVAHIAKDGHYYIHPDIQQNRSITVREAARLQSFPDNYYFEGVKENSNRTAAFRQIGNAVPPLMSYKIAQLIAKLL